MEKKALTATARRKTNTLKAKLRIARKIFTTIKKATPSKSRVKITPGILIDQLAIDSNISPIYE